MICQSKQNFSRKCITLSYVFLDIWPFKVQKGPQLKLWGKRPFFDLQTAISQEILKINRGGGAGKKLQTVR